MLTAIVHYHFRFGLRGRPWWDGWQRCRVEHCGEPEKWDRWLCTRRTKVRNQPRYDVCGEVYYYKRTEEGKVAGPGARQLDRRYGLGAYRCRHERPALLRHESAPDPEQPVQDDLLFEQIERLKLVAKEAKKKRGRRKVRLA